MTNKIARETLIDNLRKLRDELSKTPTTDDMAEHGAHGPKTYIRRFGSWGDALAEIGEEPIAKPPTDDELLTVLQDLADELGEPPTAHELAEQTKHSHRTYQNRFGSWNEAIEAAGLEVTKLYDAKVTVDCSHCGTEIERFPCLVEEQDHFFCDDDCMGAWESEQYSGAGNPRYSKYEEDCDHCGEGVLRAPWVHRQSEHTFCSRECYTGWVKVTGAMRGENSPHWDSDHKTNYGAEWYHARRDVLERDGYECSYCGLTNDRSLEKYDQSLSVHHRRPVREFDDPSDAHTMDNLVTLCRDCHQKWERMPVQFQPPAEVES